jgi:signal transduction histidine kinase/ABC-type amino acid transport substrate-binding protein/ActR/RegA family two-component response regulator
VVIALLFLISILPQLIGNHNSSAEIITLKVGIDQNAEPIEFEQNGEARGFNVDIMSAIALDMGYNVDYIFMGWTDVLESVKNGSLDIMFATETPERRTTYAFSTSYLNISWGIYTQEEVIGISTVEDLENHTVAAVKDFASYNYLKENHPDIHLIPVNTTKQGLDLLASGQIFSFYGQEHMVQYQIQKYNRTYSSIKSIGEIIKYRSMCIASNKANTDLMIKINNSFTIIFENGKYDEVYKKWYGVHLFQDPNEVSTEIWKWTIYALIGLASTTFLLMLWSYQLKKKVKQKTTEHLETTLKAQKMESIGLLAGGIAHDFNNVLMTIVGNVNILQMRKDLPEDISEHLRLIEKSAHRAHSITNQLLTFSKGGDPVLKDMGLKPIIKETVEFAMHGSNCKSEIKIEDNLPKTKIDGGQIGQVLNNLVINAQQSMPQGGKIIISAKVIKYEELEKNVKSTLKDEEYIQIQVSDHGKGIDPKNYNNIFTPYFTTKPKGSGLGLATAYSIIKNHGGLLNFSSIMGEKTTFTIFLPIIVDPIHIIEKLGRLWEIDKLKMLGNTNKALIVDDEESILRILSKMVSNFGIKADTATNGKQALEMFQNQVNLKQNYKFVVLDLNISEEMTGLDILKEMQRIDPKVKAIVASGFSNQQILSNYKEFGFIGVLKKPFTIQTLKEQLESLNFIDTLN